MSLRASSSFLADTEPRRCPSRVLKPVMIPLRVGPASLSRCQTVEDLVRHGRHLETAPNRVRSYADIVGLRRDEGLSMLSASFLVAAHRVTIELLGNKILKEYGISFVATT